MSNELIKPGSIIKLDGICKGDHMLARVKRGKFHLICIENGNRLKEKTIKESPDNTGVTYTELAAYLGPDYTFEVLYKGATPTLEAEPEPKQDLGDRGAEVTRAELERLAILAEEAGEVIQIVNKIIRHGYESYNPFDKDKLPNRYLLEKELGDLAFAVFLLAENGDVSPAHITDASEEKERKIQKYLHHQK